MNKTLNLHEGEEVILICGSIMTQIPNIDLKRKKGKYIISRINLVCICITGLDSVSFVIQC
jgi:hypothetical protein